MTEAYLFPELDFLFSLPLGRLLLGILYPLQFPLVKPRQVLGPGVGIEADFLDRVGRLALLGRRNEEVLLGSRLGEHGGIWRMVWEPIGVDRWESEK